MNELFTVKEVSQILKVDVHKVYDLIRSGLLSALKLGSLKIRRATLEKFLADYDGFDLSDLNDIHKLDFNTV